MGITQEQIKPIGEQVIPIWRDIKDLDAQIRKITKEKDSREDIVYNTDVGLFESLGEQAGEIIIFTYDAYPTEEEIKADVINYYEELSEDFYNEDGELMLNLSGRQERQAEVLTRLNLR